jgi:DNA-binding IscR family transcriptional regulator
MTRPINPVLVSQLLANRARLTDQAIVDCMALAQLHPSPDRRFKVPELMTVLGHTSLSALSRKLSTLKRAGLLEYQRGNAVEPGYRITRVGPE